MRERIHLGGREYCILKNLSSGFRERLQAYDSAADDLRAIIVLPRSSSSIQHLRVLQNLAKRNSANFPAIWETQAKGDSYFVIQAWINGHDLGRKISHATEHPERWPGPPEAFQIFRHLAHGLGQLHQDTSLVHGDIKPANLVLDRNRVFIIDFGNAWHFEQTAHRKPGDGISGAYASPEQHRGDSLIDFRSDYFSASVIAYQLLTRQLPYDGMGGKAGMTEFAEAFANKLVPPSRLASHREHMRDEFWHAIDRIVLRGLALKAADRFANKTEWLSEIEALNATMKLRPKISSAKTFFLRVVDWLGKWFKRGSSSM